MNIQINWDSLYKMLHGYHKVNSTFRADGQVEGVLNPSSEDINYSEWNTFKHLYNLMRMHASEKRGETEKPSSQGVVDTEVQTEGGPEQETEET